MPGTYSGGAQPPSSSSSSPAPARTRVPRRTTRTHGTRKGDSSGGNHRKSGSSTSSSTTTDTKTSGSATGSGTATDTKSPPPADLGGASPTYPGGPAFLDRAANYGRAAAVPYLNTEAGVNDITTNPQDFFNYINTMAGLSPLSASPFGQWLGDPAFKQLDANYAMATKVNPNLTARSYFNTLGVPWDAQNYAPARPTPLGTGQAVDTGNPYTSSSGFGAAPPALSTPATPKAVKATPEQVALGTTPTQVLTTKGKGKNASSMVTPRPTWQESLQRASPAAGLGATATNLGGYADFMRKQFLSLAPQLRGESVFGQSSPGRWSAWG